MVVVVVGGIDLLENDLGRDPDLIADAVYVYIGKVSVSLNNGQYECKSLKMRNG